MNKDIPRAKLSSYACFVQTLNLSTYLDKYNLNKLS
uniref:Uncharacterized protein n=1 Tax=Astyanax mexicanus TaxID=7994 RepID=A0A3B1KA18_ASTMX